MKVSVHWLKEFVPFDLSPEELSVLLRNRGFDVASITSCGGPVQKVVTARVETVAKHPNADKLSVCSVFDGHDTLQIVCGAPNVAAGQIVPLAKIGATLPGGLVIEKAKLRGEESSGMLCSRRELRLAEDHSGIMVLPADTVVGQDVQSLLMLGDSVLDIEVTPNRPDVLSHWGVAREIAAALKKPLQWPEIKISKPGKAVASFIRIEAEDLCTRYTARLVQNVTVRESPLWMQMRLLRCGFRPINNIVDITNYILLELGHPLHAFDQDTLAESRIVVRLSRDGESIACLDGATRQLKDALVIADAKSPVALAGIMGGEKTSVQSGTKNLLVESAHFQPATVRRTSRKLGLSTESSYRFERGTSFEMADIASRRALHLILKTAGGVFSGEQDVSTHKPKTRPLHVSVKRLQELLGVPVSAGDVRTALKSMDFQVKSTTTNLTIIPPMHRQDVQETADVAEEIIRTLGYDRLQGRLRGAPGRAESPDRRRQMMLSGRQFLIGAGFWETRHAGLISRESAQKFYGETQPPFVELENPISTSGELLGTTLLINLLLTLNRNIRQGQRDVRLFETATVFHRMAASPAETISENLSLAWVATGSFQADHWKSRARPLEFWDAKSWLTGLMAEWKVSDWTADSADLPAWLHPQEALRIMAGGRRIGFMGRIHPHQVARWDISPDTYLCEIDLNALSAMPGVPVRYQELPKHPAVIRDVSLVLPETTPWADIVIFLKKRFDLIEQIDLFDVFKDASLPESHRSLSFRLTLRHADKTLSDRESSDIFQSILDDLQREFQGQLRTAAPK